jgi:antitoxin (DNA-binding transcriptional repressor) of toxin-antitoxin stability system
MKTMSIRDLRQRWPEAEAALELEEEIIITRDSKPVAKLTRIAPGQPKRKRWDPEAHARWQRKVSGGVLPRSEGALSKAREDRKFNGK